MRSNAARPRQVPVTEDPLIGSDPYDYADAFEVQVSQRDGRSAEAWARSGFENVPDVMQGLVRWVLTTILRFRLGPRSADHVFGFKVLKSEAQCVHLEASSPLLRAVIVVRRPDLSRAVFTTFICFNRPVAARAIWTVVSPLHRAVARHVLRRAAASTEPH
jgi:hypothetical protein